MRIYTTYAIVATFALALALKAKDPDCNRTTMEMAAARGYPIENHTIVTDDRYILTTFRIPGKKGQKYAHGRPILIAHGILGTSDNLLDNGDDSIGYKLADLGYDVWLMNNRGNTYSRKHRTWNPDTDTGYWEYSFYEMGIFDMEANIDYIRKVTRYPNVSYIGYSQSAGAVLAAMTDNPAYFKKALRSVVLWAPVSNMNNSNELLHVVYTSRALQTLEVLGKRELFPFNPTISYYTSELCKLFPPLCNMMLSMLADRDPYSVDQERWEVLMSHYPAGTSTESALHILQMKDYAKFMKYKRTAFDKAEEYNMTNIDQTVPIAVMIGGNDKLSVKKDGRWLRQILEKAGALKLYKEYEIMGHITFVLPAKQARQFMFDTIDFLKDY